MPETCKVCRQQHFAQQIRPPAKEIRILVLRTEEISRLFREWSFHRLNYPEALLPLYCILYVQPWPIPSNPTKLRPKVDTALYDHPL